MLVPLLLQYLETLSGLVDSNLNCGPVLTWMELDNHGRRLLLSEEASLNIPAVAAAHVIKRYTAQAPDELSFEVGDIVSVIDMPPTEDRSWWRGKRGFQVGFFPSECVELFTERPGPGLKGDADGPPCGVPTPQGVSSLTSAVPRPRGKLAGLLRTFMRSRPSRQRLRQRGILRQRVFGCDLGEHLSNSGQDVPQVLRCCSEFIEAHGVVDGIYRLSGVSSNIQRLRTSTVCPPFASCTSGSCRTPCSHTNSMGSSVKPCQCLGRRNAWCVSTTSSNSCPHHTTGPWSTC
uniref:SH3 domain-containing protein n=1 Tax=Felis catus TaxID=9685 RepID=A0ABI7X1S9_FELCA